MSTGPPARSWWTRRPTPPSTPSSPPTTGARRSRASSTPRSTSTRSRSSARPPTPWPRSWPATWIIWRWTISWSAGPEGRRPPGLDPAFDHLPIGSAQEQTHQIDGSLLFEIGGVDVLLAAPEEPRAIDVPDVVRSRVVPIETAPSQSPLAEVLQPRRHPQDRVPPRIERRDAIGQVRDRVPVRRLGG